MIKATREQINGLLSYLKSTGKKIYWINDSRFGFDFITIQSTLRFNIDDIAHFEDDRTGGWGLYDEDINGIS